MRPGSRYARALTVLCGSAALAATIAPSSASAQAVLPDGRNYELVSPVDKPSNANFSRVGSVSADGTGVLWQSYDGFADAPSGLFNTYLSRRTGETWSTNSLTQAATPPLNGRSTQLQEFQNPSFDRGVLIRIDANQDVQLYDRSTGVMTLASVDISTSPSGVQVVYGGASEDYSHVAFQTDADLGLSSAMGQFEVYDSVNGVARLASVLPNGQPAPHGAVIGSGGSSLGGVTRHAVSADGAKIFFTADGEIYERVNGTTTVDLTASQTAPDPNGPQPKTYMGASTDGSLVFFTSNEALTAGANTNGDTTTELYSYNTISGQLSLVSTGFDAGGSQLQGMVGLSNDASSGYFVADGTLTSGGGSAGQPNLYGFDGSGIHFVATLDPADSNVWTPAISSRVARTSPDGKHLVFLSLRQLTAYDNADAGGTPREEVYAYSVGDSGPTCVSCDPSGAAPVGDAQFTGLPSANFTSDFNPSRNVSDDGQRIFFETPDPLVADDSNSQQDVYEFQGGAPSLLSTGTNSYPAVFIDASASGDDAVFMTRDRLVAADQDSLYDVYDARVGAPAPVQASEGPTACSGDGCRPPLTTPPVLTFPSTLTFFGEGNSSSDTPSAKGTVSVSPISAAQRSAFAKTGLLTLKVRVSGGGRVSGTVRAPLGRNRSWVIVGQAATTTRSAGTVSLKLRLGSSGRRTLNKHGRLSLRVKVGFSGATSQPLAHLTLWVVKTKERQPSKTTKKLKARRV
jgi:hypothetical protein